MTTVICISSPPRPVPTSRRLPAVQRDEVGEHQLAAGPRGGQVGSDVDQRFRPLRPVDEHQDPVRRAAGQPRPVRGGRVALHDLVRVIDRSSGPLIAVVTRAMTTIRAYSGLVMMCSWSPTPRMTSLGQAPGVHQRGDHAGVAAADAGDLGAEVGADQLAADGDDQDRAELLEARIADGGQVDAQARTPRSRAGAAPATLTCSRPLEDLLAQARTASRGMIDAEQERAEDEVQAHPVGGVSRRAAARPARWPGRSG